MLYLLLSYLKVIRRGLKSTWISVGLESCPASPLQSSDKTPSRKVMPLPLTLGLKAVTILTTQVMRLLGFLCSPKKVLRFPLQDTCCKTQGLKLWWTNFAFCLFWGRSHLMHSVDQTDNLCPLWMVAGLSGDYFTTLKASGKYLCREQE